MNTNNLSDAIAPSAQGGLAQIRTLMLRTEAGEAESVLLEFRDDTPIAEKTPMWELARAYALIHVGRFTEALAALQSIQKAYSGTTFAEFASLLKMDIPPET